MYNIILETNEDGNYVAINGETDNEFAVGESRVEAIGKLILLLQDSIKVNGFNFTITPDEEELEEDLSRVG